MGEHSLLRFLNKDCGPIVRLRTYGYPEDVSPYFWYSLADLSDEITGGYRSGDVLSFCGAGWAASRLLSQEKAIVEAIERWAFRYYSVHDSGSACLDLDSTSNGFAALPASFGPLKVHISSVCEAIERYVLNQIWMGKDVYLEDCTTYLSPNVLRLFGQSDGSLRLFKAVLSLNDSGKISQITGATDLKFVIALFDRSTGGVLPGSACGEDISSVAERAGLEAFNHLVAIKNIENGYAQPSETITDRRLVYFGTSKSAANMVWSVINSCAAGSRQIVEPDLIFMDNLPGPWEPEVHVARAVVDQSPPITEGDETRFLI